MQSKRSTTSFCDMSQLIESILKALTASGDNIQETCWPVNESQDNALCFALLSAWRRAPDLEPVAGRHGIG